LSIGSAGLGLYLLSRGEWGVCWRKRRGELQVQKTAQNAHLQRWRRTIRPEMMTGASPIPGHNEKSILGKTLKKGLGYTKQALAKPKSQRERTQILGREKAVGTTRRGGGVCGIELTRKKALQRHIRPAPKNQPKNPSPFKETPPHQTKKDQSRETEKKKAFVR